VTDGPSVVCFARQDYDEAERYLLDAINLIQTPLAEAWEAAVVMCRQKALWMSTALCSV